MGEQVNKMMENPIQMTNSETSVSRRIFFFDPNDLFITFRKIGSSRLVVVGPSTRYE